MTSVDPRKLFILFCLALSPYARAQTVAVAELDGHIGDQSGAGIPNVQVKMIQLATQQPHVTVTDAAGRYQLPDLPVGAYRLEVNASGFKNYIQNGIILEVSQHVEVDVTMQLAVFLKGNPQLLSLEPMAIV